MKNKKNAALRLTRGAAVAALYVVLTVLSAIFGIASGVIQFRLSEALCVLPLVLPESIIGLTVGCLLANVLTGAAALDCAFGTIATLVAAILTRAMGRLSKRHSILQNFLAGVPAVIANAAIVPPLLVYVYRAEGGLPFFILTVSLGEITTAVLLGGLLLTALNRRGVFRR